jgi:hypothetical protein
MACGPGARPGDDVGDDDAPPMTCTGSETNCMGNVYQTCENGVFVDSQVCSGACVVGVGCQECNPAVQTFCDGDSVYMCNADGTKGGLVETCAFESCVGGMCSDPCSAADGGCPARS